jgi:hypothetical protein
MSIASVNVTTDRLTSVSIRLGLKLELVERLVILLLDYLGHLGQGNLVLVLLLIDPVLELAALIAPFEELELRFDLVVKDALLAE